MTRPSEPKNLKILNGDEPGLVLFSSSEEDTRAFGRAFGRALVPGVTALLDGELGAGKTVFVRGIGDELGASGVRSPSFTLVNEYHTQKGLFLVHADLYRLDPDGVDALGLDEYAGSQDAALLVEWPERWAFPPKDDVLKIKFDAMDEQERRLTLRASGERAEAVMNALTRHFKQINR